MKNSLDNYVKAYEGELQYDFDNEILLNWYPQRILKFAKGATSLLELGLGHGYTTNIFSQYFPNHLVIEGSNAIIQHFQKKFPECTAQIVESYFEDYETTETFDVIVMGFILEHVDDPVKILKHYRKFLNADGKLFIAVPNAEVMNRRLGFLAGLLDDMQSLSENDHLLGHQRYYTVELLKNDIETAGYSVEKFEGIYLKPLTSKQMMSLGFDSRIIDAFCKLGIDYPELSCGILAELTVK